MTNYPQYVMYECYLLLNVHVVYLPITVYGKILQPFQDRWAHIMCNNINSNINNGIYVMRKRLRVTKTHIITGTPYDILECIVPGSTCIACILTDLHNMYMIQ